MVGSVVEISYIETINRKRLGNTEDCIKGMPHISDMPDGVLMKSTTMVINNYYNNLGTRGISQQGEFSPDAGGAVDIIQNFSIIIAYGTAATVAATFIKNILGIIIDWRSIRKSVSYIEITYKGQKMRVRNGDSIDDLLLRINILDDDNK